MSLSRDIKRSAKAVVDGAQDLASDIQRRIGRRLGGSAGDQGRTVVVGIDGKEHMMGTKPRPEPPECPPGWTVGPPHFVIVGAEKSGTSRWLKILREHPDVHIGRGVREIHFWDDMASRWPTQDDIDRYHRFFPRPEGGVTGEKTPQYMSLWWAPRMLAQAAPEARLIVMLRDPIDRYVSGRTQVEKYRPAPGTGGQADYDRRAVEISMHRGQYALQLHWLLEAFPREQLLILQYEACNADPQVQLDRTFAHIGVGPWAVPEELLAREVNTAWMEKVPLEPEREALLRALYRPEVIRLKEMVPELDLSLWPSYADLAG